jgi:hypothetical protein
MTPTEIFTISPRFCGPPKSGNGGYVAGTLASYSQVPVRVRLRKPPPLDVPLRVHRLEGNKLELRCEDELVGEATPHDFTLEVPPAPSYAEALNVSRRYVGFHHHPFPTCFVCGPKRARGDGLRIFPSTYGDSNLVIAPWLPDATLGDEAGKVYARFMWAALDCPGWFAATNEARTMLLGEIAATIDRRVHISESCVVAGWKLAAEGRKHRVATVLYDGDGEPCARAIATWIEPAAPSP